MKTGFYMLFLALIFLA
jgi:hypothetical protein